MCYGPLKAKLINLRTRKRNIVNTKDNIKQ